MRIRIFARINDLPAGPIVHDEMSRVTNLPS